MTARHKLKFRWLPGPYAIVRLAPDAPIPAWAMRGEFTSISRSTDELSIVCSADSLPPDVHFPHRWICLKLEGPFAFEQTGVLLSFIEPLSGNGVPIFAVSTYDTDYVLIQEEFATSARAVLAQAGHLLEPSGPPSDLRFPPYGADARRYVRSYVVIANIVALILVEGWAADLRG